VTAAVIAGQVAPQRLACYRELLAEIDT